MAYKRISPMPVVEGGTGIQSATGFGTLCGGTTGTGSLQPINPGTSGQILTSHGSSALPTFVTPGSGTIYLNLWAQNNVRIGSTSPNYSYIICDTSSNTHQKLTYLMQLDLVLTPTNNTQYVTLSMTDAPSGDPINALGQFSTTFYNYNSTTPTLIANKITPTLSAGVTYYLSANIWWFNVYRSAIVGQYRAFPAVSGRISISGSDGSLYSGFVIGQNAIGNGSLFIIGVQCGPGSGSTNYVNGLMTLYSLQEY